MKRIVIITLIAAAVILRAENVLCARESINFGVIIPLSGEAAEVGAAMKNGAILAYESLPDSLKSKINLLFEDDNLSSRNTISAFRKLNSDQGLSVVLNAGSGPGAALAPIAEKAKVPLIAVATDLSINHGRSYVLNMVVTPDKMAESAHDEAVRRGYKNIARVTVINDWGISVKEAFDSVNKHLDIVFDQDLLPTEKDYRSIITKIKKEKNLDAVLVLLYLEQAGLFVKQCKAYNVSVPFFSIEMFEDTSAQTVAGESLEGEWYVNNGEEDWFLKKYYQRFPAAPLYGASYSYDSFMLVAEAVGKGYLDSRQINQYLHNFKDFRGSMGVYSANGKNAFTIPAKIKVVQ